MLSLRDIKLVMATPSWLETLNNSKVAKSSNEKNILTRIDHPKQFPVKKDLQC